MKQTLEESAREAVNMHYNCNGEYPCKERDYCEHQNGHNTAFDCCECGADEFKEGFIAGAKWWAKQFPWISTKDKLPDDEDLVITGCWCTDYFKYLQQGWYCRECNEWYDTNGDKICVTHWMPIPDLEE